MIFTELLTYIKHASLPSRLRLSPPAPTASAVSSPNGGVVSSPSTGRNELSSTAQPRPVGYPKSKSGRISGTRF